MDVRVPDFVTHYFEKDVGAFKSMTDAGRLRAREIFFDLKRNGTGAKSKFTVEYLDLREEVERWLYQEFIRAGGNPQRKNPIYTVLGSCDWLMDWYDNGCKQILPLKSIKHKQASFTYPDSMISYQLFSGKNTGSLKYEIKEYYGKVYPIERLPEIIGKYGLPKGKLVKGKPDFEMYIEIQLWDAP